MLKGHCVLGLALDHRGAEVGSAGPALMGLASWPTEGAWGRAVGLGCALSESHFRGSVDVQKGAGSWVGS